MRKLILVLLAGVGIYAVIRYVPAETRHKTLSAIGVADFFQETLPRFFRAKLSIPENPEVKRKKLIAELSRSVDAIDRGLNAVSPPADAKAKAAVKLPTPGEIKGKVEEVRELLSKSEETLKQLADANSGESVLRKAALGLVDKVFPPAVESGGGQTATCPTP